MKPENIFITKDDQIKILDFGLAKRFYPDAVEDRANFETLTQNTEHGVVLGTVPYMSPEQARGEDLDPKSDIFSAGIVLYELLTGKLPFVGPSAAVTLHKIIYEDCAVRYVSFESGVPRAVDLSHSTGAHTAENRVWSKCSTFDELHGSKI